MTTVKPNTESEYTSPIADIYKKLGKYSRAFHWYKRAMDLGDCDAFVELGKLYLSGLGVQKNIYTAKKLFGYAISCGDLRITSSV